MTLKPMISKALHCATSQPSILFCTDPWQAPAQPLTCCTFFQPQWSCQYFKWRTLASLSSLLVENKHLGVIFRTSGLHVQNKTVVSTFGWSHFLSDFYFYVCRTARQTEQTEDAACLICLSRWKEQKTSYFSPVSRKCEPPKNVGRKFQQER